MSYFSSLVCGCLSLSVVYRKLAAVDYFPMFRWWFQLSGMIDRT